MKSAMLALCALAFLTGGAASDPIADRQAVMKKIGGLVGRELAPFGRGEKPYDAAAVMTALKALDETVKAYDVDALFPVGTETGNTKASPKIWEDRAGFQAAVDKFSSDIGAAVAANPQDLTTFQPLLGAIGANCGACHGAWRL